MFLEKTNWNDPEFKPWNLSNLGKLNQAQLNAFYDDDEVQANKIKSYHIYFNTKSVFLNIN